MVLDAGQLVGLADADELLDAGHPLDVADALDAGADDAHDDALGTHHDVGLEALVRDGLADRLDLFLLRLRAHHDDHRLATFVISLLILVSLLIPGCAPRAEATKNAGPLRVLRRGHECLCRRALPGCLVPASESTSARHVAGTLASARRVSIGDACTDHAAVSATLRAESPPYLVPAAVLG